MASIKSKVKSIGKSIATGVKSVGNAITSAVKSAVNTVSPKSQTGNALQAPLSPGIGIGTGGLITKTSGGLTTNALDKNTATLAKSIGTATPVNIGKATSSGGLTTTRTSGGSNSAIINSLNQQIANNAATFASPTNGGLSFSTLASTTPTSVSTINPSLGTGITGTKGVPTSTPTLGDITDSKTLLAGDKTQVGGLDQINKDAETARIQAIKDAEAKKKTWIDEMFKNQETRTEVRQREQDLYGVNLKDFLLKRQTAQSELQSIHEQYATIEAAMNKQIADITGSPYGTMDFTNNRIAQIQRNAAPQLNLLSAKANLKSAELASINDNWELASKFIDQAVEDSVADQKDNLVQNKMLFDNYSGTLDKIDSVYKDSWQLAIKQAEEKLQLSRDMKKIEFTQQMQQKYSTTGGGSTNFTPVQQRAYEAYRGEIQTYKSKEEALKELETNKFGIIKSIGQIGYDKLVSDIYSSSLVDKSVSFWDRLLGKGE